MSHKITFEKATIAYKEIIFSWLAEPHVQEFWDNTQDHKDDILNFMNGRNEPSNYYDGKYVYWIALAFGQPYAMIMTIQETIQDDIGELKHSHLSKTGNTYSLDYMIGNTAYIGKGYGTQTLIEFVNFFRDQFDKKADTFLIDPASDNHRAKRVYEKAGFKHIADFAMGGDCRDAGKPHHLLIKKFAPAVTLQPGGISDYPMIQNMARFYVYDLSKECGHISDDWCLPADGLFESFDFKNYFEESSQKAYLVKVYDDVAGFILLNQAVTCKDSGWNVGEFFILGRYQGQGVGRIAAEKAWRLNPGKWEVSVIPENISALRFWENTISTFTCHVFEKEIKLIDFDKDQPKRVIFNFDSRNKPGSKTKNNESSVVKAGHADIDAMNILSKQKRLAYEKAQPQFWKWAGDSGEEVQKEWFKELIYDDNYICLIAKNSEEIIGFIIGKIISAPEVYNPGGLTLMIDDFHVAPKLQSNEGGCVLQDDWATIGSALLSEIKSIARAKGVAQLVVVSGDHDAAKKSFLQKSGLTTASIWFIGGLA